jgi:hypothetical protein
MRLYVNGERITAFSASTDPSLNLESSVSNTVAHRIATDNPSTGYFNGYLADIYFIDGQALDPTSFGETDATTGVWNPKAYSGSYGTNGFHLEFADNSAATATTLGKDTSGNGNNWTPNNLSVTAGAGNDSLVDVPTNGAQTDTGAGGEVRGNYATLNPLEKSGGSSMETLNGNLEGSFTNTGQTAIIACNWYLTTGKWYAEFTATAFGNYNYITFGVQKDAYPRTYLGQNQSYSYASSTGEKTYNNTTSSYGSTYGIGDAIGIALDLDNGTITFYKNGVSQGQAFSGLSGAYTFAATAFGLGAFIANFGQRAFAYTAPSGFKALCTANLPTPSVTKGSSAMDVALWTGNNVNNRQITGLGFSPDLVWIKSRSSAAFHNLTDIVRGTGLIIQSNTTSSEQNSSSHNGAVGAFNSDGFTLTQGLSLDDVNASATTYVGWAFDGGSSTVTNTAGSITSSVRANATAGFSVVTYSGNSTTGATVGHGLGVAPSMIILKARNRADAWCIYHTSNGSGKYMTFTTGAVATSSAIFNAAPTSTVFQLGSDSAVNGAFDYVGYCFSQVVGYSSFGSYTGNGSSDGPFVFTGMRPRWLLIKSTGVQGWYLWDSARDSYNAAIALLSPNNSNAESVLSNHAIDFVSNGFKVRDSNTAFNQSGVTYIYAAFAESPFNYSRAR